MNSKEKISQVLKRIKENSEINPDERWVDFNLNHFVIGAGILSADEEERILLKLQKQGLIKLHESDHRGKVKVEILNGFEKEYSGYKGYLSERNYWNFVNPFWLIWQTLVSLQKFLIWLWDHKILSIISILFGLLTLDYTMAWRNVNLIKNFILKVF